MEIYQWLFRQNGFALSRVGFFVYCNADTSKMMFGGVLEFSIKTIPYKAMIPGWKNRQSSRCLPAVGKTALLRPRLRLLQIHQCTYKFANP